MDRDPPKMSIFHEYWSVAPVLNHPKMSIFHEYWSVAPVLNHPPMCLHFLRVLNPLVQFCFSMPEKNGQNCTAMGCEAEGRAEVQARVLL